ncbi:condensin complex subunit 2 [Microbacterium sp. Marseille-Q6965]|uniref:condensin complex subunit 2 n=1 Tax=Microbacterium sp. Marseille-Q6965 TaxID=2965072 RepID=UPI0021B80DBD|nr:condensin complex subunit 2 [Microbacterium sp. Marseille-Q6965]
MTEDVAAQTPRRRTALVLALVAITVVVIGAATAWWLTAGGSEPRATAQRFLDALVAGDAEALRVVTDADDDALALFAQAREHASGAALGAVETDGDDALLRATVTLGGERAEVAVPMRRLGETWIVQSATALTVTPGLGDAFAIGDAAFSADEAPRLLPALYEVAPLPAEVLRGSAEVAILPGQETAALDLDVAIADDATAVVQQHLAEHAADCAAATDAIPDACGIVVPWAADLRALERVAFTVERVPEVSLDTAAMAFEATGGALVAEVTGTAHDGTARTFSYRTDDWIMRGALAFRDAQLVLMVF